MSESEKPARKRKKPAASGAGRTARPAKSPAASPEAAGGLALTPAPPGTPVAPVSDVPFSDPGRFDEVGREGWQRGFFAEHRMRAAQIPRRFMSRTLANFDCPDKLRKHLVRDAESFARSFKPEGQLGLLMAGPVGCGKSHLAVAILKEVIANGFTGLYYNSPDLLRDIRATFDDNSPMSEDDLLEQVTETDLLVLDDVGAEKISDFVLDRFYLIINKRYEADRPIIVTTNLEPEPLRNRLGGRIVSRLDEMCPRFGPFPNEDYRRRMIEKHG